MACFADVSAVNKKPGHQNLASVLLPVMHQLSLHYTASCELNSA